MGRVKVCVALLLLFVASAVSACEVCKSFEEYPDLGYTCWSGEPKGYSWCYGGGKLPCKGTIGAENCPVRDPLSVGRARKLMLDGGPVASDVLGCEACQSPASVAQAHPAGFGIRAH